MPQLNGTILTLDALHCTEEIIEIVVDDKGGNVILCIKNNRKVLHRKIENLFNSYKEKPDSFFEMDNKHGREEKRKTEIIKITPEKVDYPHIFTIAKVTRNRKMSTKLNFIKETENIVYYVTTLKNVTPKELSSLIRNHWSIENKLHYKKDVVMNEDCYRADCGISRVMSAIRSLVVLILSKGKQSLKVVQRKLSLKQYKAVDLLTTKSLNYWTQFFLK